jgi:predicted ester cyclase
VFNMAVDNASVVKNAVEAFNQGQAEGLQKAFGKDMSATAAESAKSLRSAFPDLKYKIDHIQSEGSQVTFTYSVSGTHKGALGQFKATDKSAQWHGWGVATVENGVITRLHTNEDWVRAGMQLGIANPTMVGTWVGGSQGTSVTLTLTQSGNGVNGTGTLSGSPDSFPISGTNNFPAVSLGGTVFGLQVSFDGTFSGPNSIPGTLTIQGFPPLSVTLNRQS